MVRSYDLRRAAWRSCHRSLPLPGPLRKLHCKPVSPRCQPATPLPLQGYGRKKFKGTVTSVAEPEPDVFFFNIE